MMTEQEQTDEARARELDRFLWHRATGPVDERVRAILVAFAVLREEAHLETKRGYIVQLSRLEAEVSRLQDEKQEAAITIRAIALAIEAARHALIGGPR